VARLTAGSSQPVPSAASGAVKGLMRRAKIRTEVAGDDDDIDAALDILAAALAQDTPDPELLDMLEQAGGRSGHAAQRVNDMFQRYGINRKVQAPEPRATQTYPAARSTQTQNAAQVRQTGEAPAAAPTPPPAAAPPSTDGDEPPPPPPFSTSSGYPEPETGNRAPGQRTPALNFTPGASAADVEELITELTQSYYAGDYQVTVETANRILQAQPGNATALEYRQKSEDNLIRGV